MHFLSNMNVIVCIVLLSVSINTIKGIYRIPIDKRFRAHSDESDNTESEMRIETDNDNPQIERELNSVDSNDTKEESLDLKFTDFVLEAAKVLKTYENNVLEQAFAIIDDELWKDVYKGCKSYELADIKKYASDKLGLLKDAPAKTLRQHLDHIIEVLTNEDYGEIQDLVDYINSLYVGESDKFVEVLLALVHRRISDDVDLADILKGALQYFLFDHYCNLDDIVRHELMKMIKHYWRQYMTRAEHGSYKETLPFVTPFIYENDNEQLHKKRRFNKVKAGRPLALRLTDKSEPGEKIHLGENKNNMRANSKEISNESSNLAERDKEVTWDKSIYTSMRRNGSTEEHTVSKSFKASTTDKNIKARSRGGHSTVADKIQSFPLKSEPTSVIRQSKNSNTIQRLINIGNLAKEINDMIGPEGKTLRNGQYLMDWDSIYGMDLLGLMLSDENFEPTTTTTTEMIKEVERNNIKGVIITMKANYQE